MVASDEVLNGRPAGGECQNRAAGTGDGLHGRPHLSFLIPGSSENRWSDLLACLVATDPLPISELLGVTIDTVRREVKGSRGTAGRTSDRLDLLLERGGTPVAVIEAKLLANLGANQLGRYRAAFPGADQYRVLHLARLPVNLKTAAPWEALTWESVLGAYIDSRHPWVRSTARAWLTDLDALVPPVGPNTVWRDVPDDAAGMELALRARIAWLSSQLDTWCTLEHDVVQSSGGGSWAVRMWSPNFSPQHAVTVELQEGLTATEWKPDPEKPYRDRLKGPVVLVGLRQDGVTTSAGFDWPSLHRLFTDHLINGQGQPRDDRAWQTTTARPRDPVDKANWQTIVAAGAPPWLGKGWGMKVAQGVGVCLFGARYGLPPRSTMQQIDADLRRIADVVTEVCRTPGGGGHRA